MRILQTVCLLLLSICFASSAQAQTSPDFLEGKTAERLNYDVYFQWGIIWKKAGTAVLSMEQRKYEGSDAYFMALTGMTTPFFDKVTRVRDTLNAFTTRSLQPLFYEKIVHEGDYVAHDVLKYSYKGGATLGQVKQYRRGTLRRDTTVRVSGEAYDMLSVFYYLRKLNLAGMKQGEKLMTTIYSGRQAYKVQVQYTKDDKYKTPRNKVYDCYFLEVRFFDENGRISKNDNIDVWISKTPDKKPIHMAGKLKVGSLRSIIAE
ncbi:MAG: DUF3108 domain-containing protein [Bacteroidales bacterium]